MLRILSRNGFLSVVILTLSAMILTACQDEAGVSAERIRHAIAMNLPIGFKLDNLEVVASENVGNNVEPEYTSRSTVGVSFSEDFYEKVTTVLGTPIYSQSAKAGDKLTGTVVTRATPEGEGWAVDIVKVDFPDVDGKAASRFGVTEFVLVDSERYAALKAEATKQAKEKARKAEERRAKLEAERKARVTQLRKEVAGTWITIHPVKRDGNVWSSRNGGQLGYQITIPEGDALVGEGTGVIFDYQNPIDEVIHPITYQIDDMGKFVQFKFSEEVEHATLNLTSGSNWWQLMPDGEMNLSGSRSKWSATMQKDGAALAKRREQTEGFRKLVEKYDAPLGNTDFGGLPLKEGTNGYFIVRGDITGEIYGDDVYTDGSSVQTAAVHQGFLKHNQWGILKIASMGYRSADFPASKKNGVTSKATKRGEMAYRLEGVEKLPIY